MTKKVGIQLSNVGNVTEVGGHGGFFGMAPKDEAILHGVCPFVNTRTER